MIYLQTKQLNNISANLVHRDKFIFNKQKIIKVSKRYMLSTCIEFAKKGYNLMRPRTPTQPLTTLIGVVRKNTATKGPKPTMTWSEEHQVIILLPKDYSNNNHVLIIDEDQPLNNGYYQVYAVFTSSKHPFYGKKPWPVSLMNYEGQNKPQNAHIHYSKKYIIHSSVIKMHEKATFVLRTDPDYQKFIQRVAEQFNLPEDKLQPITFHELP